jgi:hypothetical protein
VTPSLSPSLKEIKEEKRKKEEERELQINLLWRKSQSD